MCGLCGVLSTTVSDDEFEKFADLFNVSSFRGAHSSGLFSIKEVTSKNNKDKPKYSTNIIKGVGPSAWFTENNWGSIKEKIHDDADTILVAGHCRHATRGTVSSANAHPFNFSNIIGMHNGTLTDNIGPKISRKDKKGKEIVVDETDSESFFRYLNDHTIEEALGELKQYTDAYAFIWYNKVERTLNFIRNEKRPLWIAQANASTIYWASEKEMLQFVLNRSYSGGYSNNIDKLAEIPVNTLISYKVDAANPTQNCTVRKIEIKSKYTYTNNTHNPNRFRYADEYFGDWYQGYDKEPYAATNNNTAFKSDRPGENEIPFGEDSGATETKTAESLREDIKQSLIRKFNERNPSNVITLPVIPKGESSEITFEIKDKLFSRKEYQRKLEKGCAWCSSQADLADKVNWHTYDEYVCADCYADPEVKQYLVSSN